MVTNPAPLSALYRQNPVKACRAALRKTIRVPWKERLDAINQLLGLHGTEAIRGEWQNGYWCDIVAVYCNTGDSYGVTVIHQRGEGSWDESGRFFVGNIGDWIERHGERHGVQ